MKQRHLAMARNAGRGLRRSALIAAAALAGMLLALAGRSPTRFERALSRELSSLRRRLLGIDRDAIVRTLGPPRTAVLTEAAGIPGALLDSAETWYYPMSRRAALVVGFKSNIASRVEFLNLSARVF